MFTLSPATTPKDFPLTPLYKFQIMYVFNELVYSSSTIKPSSTNLDEYPHKSHGLDKYPLKTRVTTIGILLHDTSICKRNSRSALPPTPHLQNGLSTVSIPKRRAIHSPLIYTTGHPPTPHIQDRPSTHPTATRWATHLPHPCIHS